ncbi:MAG TPA: glycosyltransferase [Aquaticitalea sp.]|nr:glycosyltransferase [Aquaticitalea sp.]HNU59170.1 glycosyltransferase [Aquaticitalea sp.]
MLFFDVLLLLFIVVVITQIVFYCIVFGAFAYSKTESGDASLKSVSVLICAKNEAKNLKKNLPFIIEQDYPKYEIVLINDGSTDDTLSVMEDFKQQHQNIKIVNVKSIEAFWGNKKYALTLGIKAATHEQLLFTDADCKPVSNQWIKEMAGHFSDGRSIVLGYGAYKKKPKSFLNKLIRYETLLTAIQYFSLARIGDPYMAVGRNLAYTKSAFFEARGFMFHMNIKSGDDDLFVNQTGNSNNTAICTTKNSFTESSPKKTYSDWILQKRRHISTAKHYKMKHKVILTIFFMSQFLFYTLAVTLLSFLFFWELLIGLIILRYILVGITLFLASKKLNEKDLMVLFPFLELFLVIAQLSIFIKNLHSTPSHWK